MKTPEQERDHGSADDGQRAEVLFTKAQDAQDAYWQALAELEEETGLDIDGTRDLGDVTLDDLYAEQRESESEESESESANCSCDDPSHIHPERF